MLQPRISRRTRSLTLIVPLNSRSPSISPVQTVRGESRKIGRATPANDTIAPLAEAGPTRTTSLRTFNECCSRIDICMPRVNIANDILHVSLLSVDIDIHWTFTCGNVCSMGQQKLECANAITRQGIGKRQTVGQRVSNLITAVAFSSIPSFSHTPRVSFPSGKLDFSRCRRGPPGSPCSQRIRIIRENVITSSYATRQF